MSRLAKKILLALPDFPRRRFNVFSGTSTWEEWISVLRDYLVPRRSHEDAVAIKAYEKAFAGAAGVQYAFSFGSGRMALYAILEALGIGEGDEVIIPAYTCVVVPNALIYRGAKPVYVDIDPITFNIDTAKIERAVTRRTKALYAQHTFGISGDVDAIRQIADRHGLHVIEDAAHALGATYKGRKAGGLGDVAFFSTDHSKVINTMVGGMVTTGDASLAGQIAAIQNRTPFLGQGQTRKIMRTFLIEYAIFSPRWLWIGRSLHSVLNRAALLFFFDDELKTTKPDEYPYPCRLSSVQARLGLSQLKQLDANLAHRQAIAGWLESRVGWYAGTRGEQTRDHSWLRYSFLVKDRAQFVSRFRRNFDLGIWFTSVVQGRDHDLDAVAYREGSCPVAQAVARHIVNIPTHPRVPLASIQEAWGHNGEWVKSNLYKTDEKVLSN